MAKRQKTRKSATRRFRITKNGKVLRGRAFTSHLNEKRSGQKRMSQRRVVLVTGAYAKKVKKALGIRKRKPKNGKI